MSLIDFGPALAVADAALRQAWPNGVLAPRSWAEAPGPGPAEPWWNRTQCLVLGRRYARLEVRLRFMQVTSRGSGHPVAREARAAFALADLLDDGRTVTVASPEGAVRGRMVIHAELETAVFPLYRLSVRVENTFPHVSARMPRQDVLCRSLVSTQLLIGVTGGSFLSLLDPPRLAQRAAASCRNVRTVPVLAGPSGTSRLMLSTPIPLPDHPRAVPDRSEIIAADEILSL